MTTPQLALMLAAILPLATQTALAQHHHHHGGHYTPGYHIDHHDHVVRDGHGHVIGRYHHDVVHQNSTYIVPHTSHSAHHGTYHVHNNRYYYTPRTALIQTSFSWGSTRCR